MRRFKHSKTWILLALLSLFSLAAAPAFALGCCCIEETAVSHHAPGQNQTAPECHEHGAAHAQKTTTNEAQITVTRICQCSEVAAPPVIFGDTARVSGHLAALVFVSPATPQLFAPFAGAPRRFVTRDFLIPRPPLLFSSPGRAPPAA